MTARYLYDNLWNGEFNPQEFSLGVNSVLGPGVLNGLQSNLVKEASDFDAVPPDGYWIDFYVITNSELTPEQKDALDNYHINHSPNPDFEDNQASLRIARILNEISKIPKASKIESDVVDFASAKRAMKQTNRALINVLNRYARMFSEQENANDPIDDQDPDA